MSVSPEDRAEIMDLAARYCHTFDSSVRRAIRKTRSSGIRLMPGSKASPWISDTPAPGRSSWTSRLGLTSLSNPSRRDPWTVLESAMRRCDR